VLDRIRQAARSGKGEKFTSLFHHISPEMLMTADYALSRKAAAGVDGMTWAEYGQDLEARLLELHERVQQGRYVPQPSRRTYILKADGRQRPLAVAALEDNAGCSGRRDRRTQGEFHRRRRHPELLRFCQPRLACQIRGHRIGDRRIVRLIGKWLRAGILEDGTVMVSETGTGQGSVISPLLANIYLHGVLDLWAQRWRRREATGDMIIVRFERASDASRFLDAMRARLEGFSLSLHPDKTRLIEFGRYPAERRKKKALGKPETFNFLGFTHICGKTRKGFFQLRRKYRSDRMRAKLNEVKQELRKRRHEPIPETGQWLGQVLNGFFNYLAVPTNFEALRVFRQRGEELWRRSLRRRSQKDLSTFERIKKPAKDDLPEPRILHPWPDARFAVKH
jgi:RNA-directed DNA polymerase